MSQVANLIYLEKVRLSFPKLAAPEASAPGAVPKYSASFLMEPNHPGYAAFHAEVLAKATEKWGPQAQAVLQFIAQDKRQRAYGNGEETIDQKTMQPYLGYPGNVVISANNASQPALYGNDGNPLMAANALYGGCYVNAQVQVWMQDNVHGKGVRCELVGVQFHSDGEAFGVAPVDPSSLFTPCAGAPAAMNPGAPGAGYGQPPVGQPPVGQPPVGQPPVGQPPVGQPPVQQAPGGYDPAAYQAPAAQPLAADPAINPATGRPWGQ